MDIPREIRQTAGVLQALAKAKPKVLKQQIHKVHPVVIKTLKRLSKNYIKGNVRLTPSQLRRIRRHKRALKELALQKTSLAKSRQLLQSGGFLQSLVLPLISLFGSLFAK